MPKDSLGRDRQRLTPQREAVLRAVRERDDHPTAGDIFVAAKQYLPAISYATVYNSLRYLRQAGLVRELSFHALCTECGKLVDFDLAEPAELTQEAARKSRFQAKSVHLTLVGRCPDCLETKANDS